MKQNSTANYIVTSPVMAKVLAKTISASLTSVQPMSKPTGILSYMDFNYHMKVFLNTEDLYKIFLYRLNFYKAFYVKVKNGNFNKCIVKGSSKIQYEPVRIYYDQYAKNGNRFQYCMELNWLYIEWIGNRLHFETEMKLGRHTDRKYNNITKKWEWKYENQSKYMPLCY